MVAFKFAQSDDSARLSEYLSPLGAWAFALGTAIGWGSFVITSNTYLGSAGPAGSVIGMVVGAVIMLLIARNYHYLMNRHPDAGGVYSYTKHAFGHDYGFLTAWFLGLTYLAILWANATSLPLFARYFLGSTFQFGLHYTMFGYDVYLGEVFLSIVALVLVSLLCMNLKRFASALMVVLAAVIVVGIAVCFGAGMAGVQGTPGAFEPAFVPDGNAFLQVIAIACVSPWAFIGFESISQSTEEFTFPRDKSFRVLASAVVVTTLLYVFVILLSVTAYPPQFDSWFDYIQNLGSLQGIEGLPGFYAARHYLGDVGVNLLCLSLFALILTSLIGNITALSRLFYALAKDSILPEPLSHLNSKGIPFKAILVTMAISCIVPFLGRTAIGWIVDVTVVGATITYGFVSAAVVKVARAREDRLEVFTGTAGLVLMVIIGAILVLPNLYSSSSLAPESYFLFILWSLIGLVVFHQILRRNSESRFGESVVVWIALLAFVMFMSLVWLEQESEDTAMNAMAEVRTYYEEGASAEGAQALVSPEQYFGFELQKVHTAFVGNTFIVLVLLAIGIGVMLSNYSYMRKKQLEGEFLLGVERIRADTDPLTGIRNKSAYVNKERALDASIAEGTAGPFAVAVFDLNGLKEVNDALGHKAGDEYICEACKLICTTFKRSPVFRIGGDEFVAVVDGDDFENRQELLDEVARIAEENLRHGGVVVAGGMSDFDPARDRSVHPVFERADKQMYQRKHALKS